MLSASAGILLFSFQLARLLAYAVPLPVAWCMIMFLMSPLAGAGIGALFKMKAKGALGGSDCLRSNSVIDSVSQAWTLTV